MLKTFIDLISTRSIWLQSWTLFDITGVKDGLLLNTGFVSKWSLLLLSHFWVYAQTQLWKHCRRMKLFHLLRLLETLCCFLFFCKNPISFTAIYEIINTWKNEYTFFRKFFSLLLILWRHFRIISARWHFNILSCASWSIAAGDCLMSCNLPSFRRN